jgi:hypothetical protein
MILEKTEPFASTTTSRTEYFDVEQKQFDEQTEKEL